MLNFEEKENVQSDETKKEKTMKRLKGHTHAHTHTHTHIHANIHTHQ